MSKIGRFCWIDLATTDASAAKDFYGKLLGWTFEEQPTPNGPYIMGKAGDGFVGGLFTNPEQPHPAWNSYVEVENAEKSTEKAKSLGANIIKDPFDVMGMGRMSVFQDPTGAFLCLWQATGQGGTLAQPQTPGAWCWNELLTTDTGKAKDFYTQLFGWSTKESPSPSGQPYTEFLLGEQPIGGMLQIQKEWGPIPPNWGVYFSVSDCDERVQMAKEFGGKVAFPPMDIPGVGRFASIQDPQNAAFSIIKLQA